MMARSLPRFPTKKEKYETITTNADTMPFCTSCGAEISAENKFCTSCGTPVETPAGPVTPPDLFPEQPVLAGKPKLSQKNLIVIGIVALLVVGAVVYVAVLPELKGLSSSKPPITQVPQTLVPGGTSYVQDAQPTNTPALPPTTVTTRQILDVRYGETYQQVYSLNKNFAFGQKEVFSQVLTQPPLSVKFNVTPVIITRQKVINIGLSSEQTINSTYTSPNAWFEVKVIDAGTGAVVDTQGFNKEFGLMTKQEFMVRNPGNYKIEFAGNDVFAEVQILTGTS